MTRTPRLLVTMGDVAGIGPEIIAKAWPALCNVCRPVVVGDPGWMQWALDLVQSPAAVVEIQHLVAADPSPDMIPCLPATDQHLESVEPGRLSAVAGRAAFDFLCRAIDSGRAGEAHGIVTCPIHKEGLRAAGLPYPGHTEILAERTGTQRFAMLLYAEGLAVVHVTLHMALRAVFSNLATEAIVDKVELLDQTLTRLLDRRPRIGVAGLNPHAGDGGLFGDEEEKIIRPAIEAAQRRGIDASGPWPSDTLFVRARHGDFDGVTAMYHDQGHIAMKLLFGRRAVNITAGLPLVRTSVAHGTAYDIAGRGLADETSLIEAARVASRLVQKQTSRQ
ncbi:MAG TPA: 4-hydroxythreonine-4-phosphate dehydrogenase PdxA [Gemmataceae bacterium]|nr:4-hydroxythreonine-4-phosphate dehydrogenase PdxA [Gemmataceae bacterium]